MNRLLLLFFTLLLPTSMAFSQQEAVTIESKTQGKRTLLFAQNHTDTIVNIFLMVNAQGYRRSADKPLLADIPPGTKKLVMTLIAIDPATASFDYNLIINTNPDNDINITREKFFVEDIAKYVQGDVVLFSTADCEKCVLLDSMLTAKKQAFRHFDINQDDKLYNQFVLYLAETGALKVNDSIPLPVIWNKTQWLPSDMPANVLAEILAEQ
ncbi:MAG: hypothetical protein ABJM06_01780 [Gilvibacter sp.]